MLAHRVEAHRLGQFDVLYDRLFVRRREARVRPPALIQHHLQILRDHAVRELSAAHGKVRHRKIRTHFVRDPAPLAHREGNIVDARPVDIGDVHRIDGMLACNADAQFLFARVRRNAPRADGLAAKFHGVVHRHVLGGCRHRKHQFQFPFVRVRRHTQGGEAHFVRIFHPHALPQPRHLHIMTAVVAACPALFAPYLQRREPIVAADDQHIFPRPQILGDVQRIPRVGALVSADLFPVHIHRGEIVRAVDVEDIPLPRALFYGARVPDGFVRCFVPDPALLRLIGERDDDLTRKFSRQRPALLDLFPESERPFPVQIFP